MLDIFQESGRKPHRIRHDHENEFSRAFSDVMKEVSVKSFQTNNEVKANYAERFIRTLKGKLYRWMYRHNTHRWLNGLSQITESYNHTFHRSIKMKPADVTQDNQAEVWVKQYGGTEPVQPPSPFKLEIGDFVRISHLRQLFKRGFDQSYTGEIFKVKSRKVIGGFNIYELQDWIDDDVLGTFYENELQKIRADPQGVFRVEKVLRKRNRGGVVEHLVKWKDWPDKYNSWVKDSDLKGL